LRFWQRPAGIDDSRAAAGVFRTGDAVLNVLVMSYARRLRGPVLALLAVPGFAAGADRARSLPQAISAAAIHGQPTVTILPSASGASLRSYSAGSASLSFGQAAYYASRTAQGVAAQKKKSSMVLSTRFAMKVDCNGSPSPLAEITLSLFSVDPTLAVSVDGLKLTTAPSTTVLQCGSLSEHQVQVEIPTTRPAGPINSTLSISAKTKY
jgi:hypothetical protein